MKRLHHRVLGSGLLGTCLGVNLSTLIYKQEWDWTAVTFSLVSACWIIFWHLEECKASKRLDDSVKK